MTYRSATISPALAGTDTATSKAGRNKDTRAAMLFGRSFERALAAYRQHPLSQVFIRAGFQPQANRVR